MGNPDVRVLGRLKTSGQRPFRVWFLKETITTDIEIKVYSTRLRLQRTAAGKKARRPTKVHCATAPTPGDHIYHAVFGKSRIYVNIAGCET